MKSCPSKLQLESAALGELHESRIVELETHAEGCGRCRHELNWLRTESALFAQRTAREEVSRLWEGVAATAVPKRSFGLTRSVLALAASALIAFAVAGRVAASLRGGGGAHGAREAVPMSLETMSVDQSQPATMPCYTPGFGIACGEVQYASR